MAEIILTHWDGVGEHFTEFKSQQNTRRRKCRQDNIQVMKNNVLRKWKKLYIININQGSSSHLSDKSMNPQTSIRFKKMKNSLLSNVTFKNM